MAAPARFFYRSPSTADYWRGVVLFGRNVASYKFALAKSLLELRPQAGTLVKLDDLAEPFSRHICEHLKIVDKQGTSGSSRFLNACREFNRGRISKEELLGTTVRLGFGNVIDAFHVVNQQPISKPFFVDERKVGDGIRITDEFSSLLGHPGAEDLPAEAESRWRLVETAWDLGVARHAVIVQSEPVLQQLFATTDGSRRARLGKRGIFRLVELLGMTEDEDRALGHCWRRRRDKAHPCYEREAQQARHGYTKKSGRSSSSFTFGRRYFAKSPTPAFRSTSSSMRN